MGKKYEIEKGWVERKEGKIGDRKRCGKYVYLPGKISGGSGNKLELSEMLLVGDRKKSRGKMIDTTWKIPGGSVY